MDEREWRREVALCRYQVISGYLALDPPRGQKRALREKLASKQWVGPDGEPLDVSEETIRTWVRKYKHKGLRGLENKPHPRRGVQAMSPHQIEIACALKEEVPQRSLERIIKIMEAFGHAKPDTVKRSTLHRVLQSRGLSARACRVPDQSDLDRFEADRPNELWQSDMLAGPWLPDPERPGHVRRAYLYAFLDDHSRLLLHGRFSFKGDLPALELVFRRSLQRFGLCSRVYYDNGQTYRSKHMRHIVATLGMHRIVFTQVRRPQGHGKIEALNRLIRSAFLAELGASNITTLDQLNEAFLAWADLEYNQRPHGETGEKPIDRWRAGVEQIRYADEELLRQAFLWSDGRTPDKTGIFSLFGVRYQTSAKLARRRVEVRYDPEALDQVEIWLKDRFVERARPFEVSRHRRPRATDDRQAKPARTSAVKPTADWLGHLVERRRRESFVEPSPHQLVEDAIKRRALADQQVVDVLRGALDPAVFDEAAVREFLDRFGPFDVDQAQQIVERTIRDAGRNDHHVRFYLDAIQDELGDLSP